MKVNLQHECYKLWRSRILLYGFLALMIFMAYDVFPLKFVDKYDVAQGFGFGQWVIIIMIAISANFVTMEFRDNTMPTLLYKSSSKLFPYLAKFIALLGAALMMMVGGTIFALVLYLCVAHRYPLTLIVDHHSLLANFGAEFAGTIIYLIFWISLALLLVLLFKSNATVIVIGLAVGFLGSPISEVLMKALPGLKASIAWNPLNMISIISPFANNASIVYLTTGQLIVGNLIYSALFLLLGLWVMKRERI